MGLDGPRWASTPRDCFAGAKRMIPDRGLPRYAVTHRPQPPTDRSPDAAPRRLPPHAARLAPPAPPPPPPPTEPAPHPPASHMPYDGAPFARERGGAPVLYHTITA